MKLRVATSIVLMTVRALAADVSGEWKATTQGPNGEMHVTFNLKQDGGIVTGMVDGPIGEKAVSEGKIDGDNISFTVATDQLDVVHKGTVSGDEMKLKLEIGDQTMEMTAARAKS